MKACPGCGREFKIVFSAPKQEVLPDIKPKKAAHCDYCMKPPYRDDMCRSHYEASIETAPLPQNGRVIMDNKKEVPSHGLVRKEELAANGYQNEDLPEFPI